jgi:GxxExxY protein
MDVLSQYPVALSYKGVKLKDGLIMDFYIPGQLVIELKAVVRIVPVHEAQLLSYFASHERKWAF